MPFLLSMGSGRLLDKKAWFLYLIKSLVQPLITRAVSSAVEYRSYKPGVTGSNPVPPTNFDLSYSKIDNRIFTSFDESSRQAGERAKKRGG